MSADLDSIAPDAVAEMNRFTARRPESAGVGDRGRAQTLTQILSLLADERGLEPDAGELADAAERSFADLEPPAESAGSVKAADFMSFAEDEAAKRSMAESMAASVQDRSVVGVCGNFAMEWIIQRLAARIRREGLDVVCSPSKFAFAAKFRRSGIDYADSLDVDSFDSVICGAGRVDSILNVNFDSMEDRAMIGSCMKISIGSLNANVIDRFGMDPISVDVPPADREAVMERIGAELESNFGEGGKVAARLDPAGEPEEFAFGMNKIMVSGPFRTAPLASVVADVRGVVGVSFLPVAKVVPHASITIGISEGGVNTVIFRNGDALNAPRKST